MNKVELSEKIASKVGITRKQALAVLDAFEEVVIDALKKGQEVTLTGFGTFLAKSRHARMGVNPLNPKERIKIPQVTVAKFRTGKTLKDALKHVGAEPAEEKPAEEKKEESAPAPATPAPASEEKPEQEQSSQE